MMAEDMYKYLNSKGFGTENFNLFFDFKPDSPDNLIVTFDVESPPLPESNTLSVDLYTVQILTRNTNKTFARNLLIAIHKQLLGFGGEKLIPSGEMVSVITINTMPTSLGKDSKGRNEYSAHYDIRITNVGNEYRM